jgi:hypothetical protein
MLVSKRTCVSFRRAVVGVAPAIALSGCDASPEGRIVASWSLRRNNVMLTCEEALIDRVRVTAVRVDDGESSTTAPHPCADGSAVVEVAGGTYLVGVDTLAADDTVLDHGEMVAVAAADGMTAVTVNVTTATPTGSLCARWNPPCPNGAGWAELVVVEENQWTKPVPCS